jgi:NTE family protein
MAPETTEGAGGAVPVAALGKHPLFEGLDAGALEEVLAVLKPRRFATQEALCRAGEAGEQMFVIADGLAHVSLTDASGRQRVVAHLRRGDVVGEMSFVTGEPRTATVVAAVPVLAFELRNEDFGEVVARQPAILANLSRILTRRLADTTAQAAGSRQRGEAVALLVGRSAREAAAEALAAATAASTRPVAVLEAAEQLGQTLAELDDVLAEHGTVVVSTDAHREDVELLVGQVDRVIALLDADEARSWSPPGDRSVEIFTAGSRDAAWLGRHLAQTKLGLALGAGGAKGYAHVGVLQVLEDAGYTVDFVSGSSIGAVAGAWLALGMDAAEVDATMRKAFTPEVVAEIFKLSMSGASTGLDTMTRVFRETTGDATFDDLVIPLVVMTVDLVSREPAPIVEGPLWQALLAATALAGIFPPYEGDGRRLVDGLALVPVPTREVADAGADVTASVNLISRDTLPAWPGQAPPEQPEGQPRSRMLDTLLEVMDLSQLASSERHAALADVPITPRFGPSTWREFHLADLFLEAGREAAAEELPRLRALARPPLTSLST